MNLIENASKYAETKGSSGGKVEVKAHTREGYDVSAYVRSKPGQGVSLKQPISRYSSVDLEDVYNVKKALMSEGYYEPNPKLGLHEFTDEALFDGIQRFQKDNGLKVDGIMKPGGETESKINAVANNAKSLSAAGMQGLSLGWSDEISGAIKGAGYAAGNGIVRLAGKENAKKMGLNMQAFEESTGDAFKRGYASARDEHRKLLSDGQKKMPVAMTVMESAGSIASPVNIFKASKTAPLTVKATQKFKDAIAIGGIYGTGVTDKNKVSSYAQNIGAGVAGNLLGYGASRKLYGRAGSPIMEKILGEGTNYGVNKAKNLLENK